MWIVYVFKLSDTIRLERFGEAPDRLKAIMCKDEIEHSTVRVQTRANEMSQSEWDR